MARICIMWIAAYRRPGSLSHDQFPTHCVSHFPHHHTTRSHTTTLHFPNYIHHHATFSKLCTLYYSFQTVHTTPDPLCTTPATPSSLCTTLNQCTSTSTVQARTTTRCSMAPPGSAPDLCLWPRLSPYQPPLGFHQTDLLFVLTTPHPPHSYPQTLRLNKLKCNGAALPHICKSMFIPLLFLLFLFHTMLFFISMRRKGSLQ